MSNNSIKYGRHKAGYVNDTPRPINADLYFNGHKLLNNLPFPIIQAKRREMIASGYLSKNLVVKYHIEEKTRL